MKNFRKTKNCCNCIYLEMDKETETVQVSERLYQEYYTYFCRLTTPGSDADVEAPAISVCDDYDPKKEESCQDK